MRRRVVGDLHNQALDNLVERVQTEGKRVFKEIHPK